MKKSLYVSVFAAILLLFACKSQEKISMKFNPGINKKYAYVTSVDMKVNSAGETSNSVIEMGYSMQIKEKNEKGNNIVSLNYSFIKMDADGTDGKIAFDSRKTTIDSGNKELLAISKIFSGFFNNEIIMEMTPEGHVVSCKGFESIFSNVIKNTHVDTIPEMAAMVQGFKQQFSDEQFGKQMDEAFFIMPGKDVKVGDTWEKDQSKGLMGMSMSTKTKYELKEIKDNKTAVVNVSSDIDMSGDKENANPMMSGVKTQGKQTGTIDVNLETGFPMSSNMNMDMDMTIMSQTMKLSAVIKTTATEIK